MSGAFHKPVRRPGDVIETLGGSGDPAELSTVAHDTATALLHRVRGANADVVDKVMSYTAEHGIDDVAELWASADAISVPGALWRLYLLRHTVTLDPEEASYLFGRGAGSAHVDQAVVGATSAPDPEEMVALVSEILRGAFDGDFAMALERAAAFCRVMAAGSAELAASDEDERRARGESFRGARYTTMAGDLTQSAALWRAGRLN